jgi:CheY-like chemotaxis protein
VTGKPHPGGIDPSSAPLLRRALVLDDDPALRELMTGMLQSLGIETEAVTSGEEALSRLERERYDLVVTDLVMPRMTGWDVIAAIRERGLGVAIVLASGSVGNVDSRRARGLGATVLPKPFRVAELKAAVAAAAAWAAAAPEPAAGPAGQVAAEGEARRGSDPAAVPGSVARVMDTMRRAAQDLQALFAAMDVVVGERQELAARLDQLQVEHDSLRREHDAALASHREDVAALAELREAHDLATRRRHEALETLEALRGQLDRCIRDLRGRPEA